MTKQELIEKVAATAGLPPELTKKRKNGRTGRNPQTGAPIVIPPSVTVSFQPGQELKAFLNRTPLKSQG